MVNMLKKLSAFVIATIILLSEVSFSLNQDDSLFILKTDQFFNYNRTYIGNGYFSLSSTPLGITSGESYMVWVYNHGENDVLRICLLPGWKWNKIDIFNGDKWLSSEKINIINFKNYKQELNLRKCILTTSYTWSNNDKAIDIKSEIFIHRGLKNLAILKLEVKPNFSGEIKLSFLIEIPTPKERLKLELIEKLDPWPGHWIVRYPGTLTPTEKRVDLKNKIMAMLVQAKGRETKAGIAVTIDFSEIDQYQIKSINTSDSLSIYISFKAVKGKTYKFFKFVAIVPSFETEMFLDSARAIAIRARYMGYENLLKGHLSEWGRIWETNIVDGDPEL